MQINGVVMLRALVQRMQTQILLMTLVNVLHMVTLRVLFKARIALVIVVNYLQLLSIYDVCQARRARSGNTLTIVLRAMLFIYGI